MPPMYLPTIDHPPWFCAVLLVIFIPVSIWHERNWRATLAAYATMRLEAGATDADWPTAGLRRQLGVQPWLVLAAAGLLAAMVVLGAAALLVWPQKLPFFDEVINYFDRPYLAVALVAGIAAVVGALALAIDLARSPWAAVARLVRGTTYATPEARKAAFTEALAADPGVPQVTSTVQP